MNKLVALIGTKTGKKTQYEIVEEATKGGNQERFPFSSTSHSSSYSTSLSNEDERWKSIQDTRSSLRHKVLTVALVLLAILTLLELILIHKTEPSKDEVIEISAYRPCQVYSSNDKIQVIQTSLTIPSEHWSLIPCLPLQKSSEPVEFGMPTATVDIDFNKISHPDREPIMGFGGAFTEASALNFMSLNSAGRSAVLELLFGKYGLGYSIGRVHMNSCDFSVKSYSFDDIDGDFELKHFDTNVTHDVATGMVRMILEADAIIRSDWADADDHGMRILVSPWSPPAWLKAAIDGETTEHSETMTGSAFPTCVRDGVGPDSAYAKTWAKYFDKFISAYTKLGVEIFAVTVQNEPEFAAPWEACSYDAASQASFIQNHLGPLLRETYPDIKLLIFDHNKDHVITWGSLIANESNAAAKYVDGTAVHWYAGGMDRLLDGAVGASNMHRYMELLKDMKVKKDHLVLGSEGCHCPSTGYAGGDINVAWSRAERYAHTVLSDLAAGSNGFIEWNLILDAIGGPNHLGNLCDSPLLAVPYRADGRHNITNIPTFEPDDQSFSPVGDTRTREELNAMGMPAKFLDVGVVVQPMYFYMGHISRYVRPGARSVDAIFDLNHVFRHVDGDGDLTAGGGVNNLARPGIDVTLWPCEGSTRQTWELDDAGHLRVYGHDWLGNPTISCIGNHSDTSFGGLLLSDCDDTAGIFDQVETRDHYSIDGYTIVRFVVRGSASDESCLTLLPVANNGGSHGPRGGAQAILGDCRSSAARWSFINGEISSSYFASSGKDDDVCLTTGWPFLQVGAFSSDSEKNNVIILNEAADAANYEIRLQGERKLSFYIPPRSIQTISL